MKKIYLSILSVALVFGLNAQVKPSHGPVARSIEPTEKKPVSNFSNQAKTVLYSNTFDNAADWVIAHDPTACALDWQIGSNSCSGSYQIADINSTSVSDGWALMDSDAYGGAAGGTEIEDSWLTMAAPVDLNGYPNVVVEFETQYRRYNYERPYVVVGIGDGTGAASVVWPDLVPDSDISLMTNVFDVFPWAYNDGNNTSDNPQLMQINISPALVGLTSAELGDIYIRFHWTGTWGYAWFVDDFKIIEQPQNDVQTITAWVAGEYNNGMEYGRTPINHLDANYFVGAQVFNFGVQDQTNVSMIGDFTSFSNSGSAALLEADSTIVIETTEALALSAGLYQGTYTTVSDQETSSSATYNNNVYERSFEVTNDVYSLDGIGNHPSGYEDLSSLGTYSFTGAADGLIVAAMYSVKQSDVVSGIRVMLTPSTVAGGEVHASIKDTATFWANDMTSIHASNTPAIVSAADLANGYVDVWFDAPVSLLPGGYYAAVELYSFANNNDIGILDDRTVDQPWDASAIYIPADQSYSNGTAVGIRMLTGSGWGVGLDETALEGISIYPNPSEGIINVTNSNNKTNTIVVYDVLGKVVLTKVSNTFTTLDLSGNSAGVYLVDVSNENGNVVERVIIK